MRKRRSLLAVALLALDLLKGATTGDWAGFEFWVFVLVAEYAAIIRNIPPREKRQAAAPPRLQSSEQHLLTQLSRGLRSAGDDGR